MPPPPPPLYPQAPTIFRRCLLSGQHLAKVVFRGIPHHGRASVHTSPVLLHDDARDDVLVRLVERLELLEAIVDDRICPISHLFVIVGDNRSSVGRQREHFQSGQQQKRCTSFAGKRKHTYRIA